MQQVDARIEHYLDWNGRVTRWPTRKNKEDQGIILAYLASKFEAKTTYTENEVNEILKQYHTFDDWALLRRELVSHGYFSRHKDGSNYRLKSR